MANLETTYMGLKLKNPIIVSSSGLTNSVDKIKEAEENGAAAVVLKSLFEEQLHQEGGSIINISGADYPEAEDYIRNYAKNNTVDKYITLIEEAKKAVSIPVIASINCVTSKDWTSFAKKIEAAGADGIELNIHILPMDVEKSSADVEKEYLDIVEKVKEQVEIPVAVKLGNQFTNLLNMASKLHYRGVAGVVLFNRFYEPDIDINHMKFISSEVFSTHIDIRHSLRWVGIISDKVELLDISASTGIHDGEAAVKQILAGAKAVQVCSTLYMNGMGEIAKILADIEKWMGVYNYTSLDEFRGKMSYRSIPNPSVYERSQFMKYFSSIV